MKTARNSIDKNIRGFSFTQALLSSYFVVGSTLGYKDEERVSAFKERRVWLERGLDNHTHLNQTRDRPTKVQC